MSDSDTYLDNILEGLTVGEEPQQSTSKLPAPEAQEDANGTPAQPAETAAAPDTEEPAPAATSVASSLDTLLDGLTAPPAPADSETVEPEPAVGDLTEVDPEVLIGTGDLDLATPQDILGVPSEPGVVSSHIDLAQEINDVAVPSAAPPEAARERWESNHSFAAIARDISATVEVDQTSTGRAGGTSGDAEHPSFYVRTRRRRRKRRMNTVTIGQVIGLLLLLVLGLAGEYEYVSKHASPPIVAPPLATAPRIPTIAQTPVRGTLFHFAALGTADSTPFAVKSRFAIGWTARCSHPSDITGVVITVKSGGRIATAIDAAITTSTPKSGATGVLRPGTYALFTHASEGCSWTVTGLPRA